jgi:YHS domain-containing protein
MLINKLTKSLLTAVTASLLMIAFNSSAFAGEFFERDGVAIEGYDPVAYFTEKQPIQGKKEFTAEYKGSIFLFSSAVNRDKFKATPEAFAPQFNGFCAYGTAGGYKAKSDATAFTVLDGKLYLNYNAFVRTRWNLDTTGYINKAVANWPAVEKTTKVNY